MQKKLKKYLTNFFSLNKTYEDMKKRRIYDVHYELQIKNKIENVIEMVGLIKEANKKIK